MHATLITLTLLLAVLFAFTGTTKALNTVTARKNATHLGISTPLSRLIGIAELAAVIGLLAGLAFTPLATATAAAICLLMIGAAGSHLKAGDSAGALAPAAVTTLAAIALLVLTLTT
ncbi:DoxX family protein [Streptomyces sp. NPDC059002]|uniref:DoxX family protein n=1 Tax=Streptomyces sp. NPDC059002 TaxID=3346690 RepID=UPI00369F8A5E